ncbi:MAG TPA: hypothetical protein VN625_09450, partial [Desulfuromonadaceae bacterium]|nr:hypothetical protein [Desulfuromonadaceae bacterium]
MKKKFVLAILTAGALPVFACDLCSVYSAQEAQGAGKGYFAGLAEQYTSFETLLDNGHQKPADGAYLHSSVLQLFAGYNFNHRFGLQLNLPVIYRDYGSATAHGSDFGLGDISLVGNVVLYEIFTEEWTFNWTALGGIKFPT